MNAALERISAEAYRRIVTARRWNTWVIFTGLAGLAAIVYWSFYTESKLSLGLGALLSFISIFQWVIFEKVNEIEKRKGTVICPRCQGIIESKKYLGSEVPKSCEKCGLEIKESA
jgi:hypothetical protein